MYKSLKKAEEAAYSGDVPDFDTQDCLRLADAILSSPRIAADDESASNSNLGPTIIEEIAAHLTSELSARQETSLDTAAVPDNDTIEKQPGPTPEINRTDDESTRRKSIQFRRNSNGKLRPFAEGKEHQPADFEQKYRTEYEAMEEYSPKSSLSPTQANSESVYAHLFEIQRIRNELTSTQDDVAGDEVDDNRTQKESLGSKQHQSAVTDSTAFTYGEDDIGHVNLFLAAPENREMDVMSQDASFAPRAEFSNELSCEPRTPAPPVNPFSQKGSVMKGHEMFGATQPSSIGRYFASPTSSRPSPDVYNNSSPQKRIITSPLDCRDETSALQSSVREMLRTRSTSPPRVETPQMSSFRSFDSKRARREPKDTYISTKESQERRRKASSASGSETESESDTEAIPRKRQRDREREQMIQRELALVTSSRPGSGTSGDVEVPASGRRRRSVQEDYIAQCNGSDTRNTQQEEVIIDSQAIVEEPEAMDPSNDSTASATTQKSIGAPSPKSSPQLPAQRPSSAEPQRVPDLYSSRTEEVTSPPKDSASPPQQPSIPLQEVSTNRNDLRTPVGQKAQVLSDGADMTIPNTILETSPLGDDRIRPMGEITSLSFTDNAYDDAVIDEAPGFTQDLEFNNAINPRFSPSPPSKSRAQDRVFPSLEHPAAKALATSSNSLDPERSNTKDVDDTTGIATSSEPRKNSAKGNEERRSQDSRDKARVSASSEPQQDGVGGNENKGLDEPKEQVEFVENQDEEIVAPPEVEEDRPVDVINEPGEQDKTTAEAPHNEDTPNEQQKCPTRGSKTVPKPAREPATKRGGLRSKEELKGPSKALRRYEETVTPTKAPSQRPSRVTKSTSARKTNSARSSKLASDASSVLSTPLSSLASTPAPSTRSSTRKKTAAAPRVNDATPAPAQRTRKSATQAPLSKEETLVPLPAQRSSRRSTLQAQEIGEQTSASVPPTRSSKRKSVVLDDKEPVVTRASKRQSTAHTAKKSSDDLIAYPASILNVVSRVKKSNNLFSQMAFAVSYVKQDKEKSHVTDLINEQGGRILDDGFEKLFESLSSSRSRNPAGDEDADLVLTSAAKSVGFIALIADEHSRKSKYMQALALGLPCISGRWIMTCVCKGEVVDWNPYLLCAGQSSFLGNAIRSRTLAPYSATEAKFSDIVSTREKLLGGKSILLVTAKGKEDTRKAYVFLTRALGPARIGQVSDHEAARKKLLDEETWDLLYVDKNEDAAEAAVFGSSVSTSSGSKKRKRGPTAAEENAGPAPKKIRVINDEVIIQSLILGQLLEEGV